MKVLLWSVLDRFKLFFEVSNKFDVVCSKDRILLKPKIKVTYQLKLSNSLINAIEMKHFYSEIIFKKVNIFLARSRNSSSEGWGGYVKWWKLGISLDTRTNPVHISSGWRSSGRFSRRNFTTFRHRRRWRTSSSTATSVTSTESFYPRRHGRIR